MIFKHKVTKECYFQIPYAAYLCSQSCDTSVNCFFLLTTDMTNTQDRSCVEKKIPLSLDLDCILSENSEFPSYQSRKWLIGTSIDGGDSDFFFLRLELECLI